MGVIGRWCRPRARQGYVERKPRSSSDGMSAEQAFLRRLFTDDFLVRTPDLMRHWIQLLVSSARVLSVEPERGGGHGKELLHVTILLDHLPPVVLLDPFRQGDDTVPDPDGAEVYRLIGRDRGVYIGLEGTIVGSTMWRGEAAWRFDYGGRLWLLQRRQYYRMELPPVSDTVCEIITLEGASLQARMQDITPEGVSLQARMQDISLGGASMRLQGDAADAANVPAPGTRLEIIRFTLPGAKEVQCAGRIANVRQAAKVRGGHCLIGVQFDRLSIEQEKTILTYIRRREREIRRRERGY